MSRLRDLFRRRASRVESLTESRPEKGWMGTASGKQFWPLAPRAEDVDVRDVVRGLAMTCRYAGQVKFFYSVAEHCVLVSQHVADEHARYALFHDCAEAYIGDMIRPLKHQREMTAFREAERAIEDAVFRALGLDASPVAVAATKQVDNRILVDEITALSARPSMYLETPLLRNVRPLGVPIGGFSPREAERLFRARFRELFGFEVAAT